MKRVDASERLLDLRKTFGDLVQCLLNILDYFGLDSNQRLTLVAYRRISACAPVLTASYLTYDWG